MNPHEKYDAAMQHAKGWLKAFGAFVLFLAIVAGTVLTAETLLLDGIVKPILGLSESRDCATVFGYLAAFLLAAAVLFAMVKLAILLSNRLLQVEIRRRTYRVAANDRIEDCHGLVVFLSRPLSEEAARQHEQAIARIKEDNISLIDIAKGHPNLPRKWNWQPLLAAIALCGGGEKPLQVMVITSGGEDGSDQYYPQLRDILGKLAPRVKPYQVMGVNFFDADSIRAGIEQALDRLAASGVPDRCTLIDITGGTANVSAVGSMFALQEGRRIIYSGQSENGAPVSEVYHARVQFFGDLQSGL